MKTELSEEQLERVKQLLIELDADNFDQAIIQDNKIIFPYEKDLYRCKMPSQKIQSICEDDKNKYQIRLLEEGGYKTKKQLKTILKEKQDIDIDALEKDREEIKTKLKNVMLDLAQVPTENKLKLKEKRDKVKKAREELIECVAEICEHLAPSLEERVLKRYYEYVTYLCTEKQISGKKEKWEIVWNSFEKFEEDETILAYKGVQYLRTLLMSIRE